MSEDFIFKHQNRLKNHFVNVSKVLLYGYRRLSDGAKITFQVIDGFDWEDKETGDSKGFVFPAAETIAKIRNTTVRTIQRHVKELEEAKLITRQRRKYKASVLFIETVSDKEAENYFELLKKTRNARQIEKEIVSRNDKNVVSQQRSETTKMSVLYKKEDEDFKEDENNVNDNFKTFKERGNGEAVALRDILMQYGLKRSQKIKKPDSLVKRDYLAEEIAEKLNDRKSLGCFRVIADKIPQSVIFEVLASVKETANAGKIRESKGALFVMIIGKYAESRGVDLGFKRTGGG